MRTPIRSLLRSLALMLAVLGLTFGIAQPPTSAAADLNFTGTTLSGAAFSGASLQGKPAVLWFWTPLPVLQLRGSQRQRRCGR